MTVRRWHSGRAFVNSLKDLKDHASTSLFTAGLLLLPSLGTSILQNLTGRPIFGLLMLPVLIATGVWLEFCLITATREYAVGNDPGMGGLISKTAFGRLASFFGVKVILFLITLGVAIVTFIPFIGVLIAGGIASGGDLQRIFDSRFGALVVLTVIISVVAFLTITVIIRFRYGLAGAANTLEGKSPPEALGRSRQMMKNRWPDMLLLVIMLAGAGLVAWIVVGLPSLIVTFRRLAETGGMATIGRPGMLPFSRELPALPLAAALVASLSTYLLQVIMTIVSVSAITNFYLGVRGDEVVAALAPLPAPASPVSPAGNDLGALPGGKHDADPGHQQDPAGDDRRPGDLSE